MPLKSSSIKKSLCSAIALCCMAAPVLAKETLPNVELTGGLLFQIIASEFALQRHDLGTAFQTYMQTARTTKDPRLAQRAFEIADAAHAFDLAGDAAKLWETLAPQNENAQLANLLSQIRQSENSESLAKKAHKLIAESANQTEKLQRFQAIAIQAELGNWQPQEMLNFLRPLASLCKEQKEAALTLAKLYRRTDNAELGEHYAKIAWQQLPDSSAALLEYADVLISKQPKESIRLLENFVRKHPKNYDAQLGLAKAYSRTQNKKGVEKQIQVLDSFAQTLPDLAFTLASVCDNVGLTDETKRYLMMFERQAKDRKSFQDRLPRTYLSLGMIDYKLQHFKAAAEWFRQVDEGSEFYPQSRLFLAQSLAAEKQYKEALDVLNKTKVDERLQTEFLYKKAQILYDQGSIRQSYEEMKKALKTDPDNAALLYQCAIVANELHRLSEAEKYLQDAIGFHPNEADFYNTLGYLWVDNNVKLDQAQPLIEKALEMKPDNAAYLDSMGWLLFRKGQLAEAQKYLEKAVSILKDKEILLHLAEVYQMQGKTQKAMEILRPMLKENADDPVVNALMDRLHLRF